jgi:hypothetical protein
MPDQFFAFGLNSGVRLTKEQAKECADEVDWLRARVVEVEWETACAWKEAGEARQETRVRRADFHDMVKAFDDWLRHHTVGKRSLPLDQIRNKLSEMWEERYELD